MNNSNPGANIFLPLFRFIILTNTPITRNCSFYFEENVELKYFFFFLGFEENVEVYSASTCFFPSDFEENFEVELS